MLHDIFVTNDPRQNGMEFPRFWKLLIACHCISPSCLRQWMFPPKKFTFNFILMQLPDRVRLHCSYLSWTVLILHVFLKFILCIRRSCAVDACYCRCKLYRITDVMFAKQRLFAPELYLILKAQVCRCLMPPGWAILRTYQHTTTPQNTIMRKSNLAGAHYIKNGFKQK
jgi:hypothetical protein